MDIVKLSAKDLPEAIFTQLVDIENRCGLTPYSPAMLMACITQMDTYACMDEDLVAGFITIHADLRRLGGGVYIANLNVARNYRRKGIGQYLIRSACSRYPRAKIITLDVEKTNFAAIALYQKMGFEITDLPSANGDTDYVMLQSMENFRRQV